MVIRDGRFEPDSLLKAWEDMVKMAIDKGFSGVYGVGEMSWSVGTEPGWTDSRSSSPATTTSARTTRHRAMRLRCHPVRLGDTSGRDAHPSKVIIKGHCAETPTSRAVEEYARPRAENEFARLTDNILAFESHTNASSNR